MKQKANERAVFFLQKYVGEFWFLLYFFFENFFSRNLPPNQKKNHKMKKNEDIQKLPHSFVHYDSIFMPYKFHCFRVRDTRDDSKRKNWGGGAVAQTVGGGKKKYRNELAIMYVNKSQN